MFALLAAFFIHAGKKIIDSQTWNKNNIFLYRF